MICVIDISVFGVSIHPAVYLLINLSIYQTIFIYLSEYPSVFCPLSSLCAYLLSLINLSIYINIYLHLHLWMELFISLNNSFFHILSFPLFTCLSFTLTAEVYLFSLYDCVYLSTWLCVVPSPTFQHSRERKIGGT